MTRDSLALCIALPLAIAAGIIGWAVAETWTAVHTGFALAGVLMVLGIAAHGLGSAAGVALHDRRQDRALPQVRVDVPPSTGVPYLDDMYRAKVRDLDSRAHERLARADLAMVGMEPRDIPVRHWQDRPAEGWQDGAEL